MSFEEILRNIIREELTEIIKVEFERRNMPEKPTDEFLNSSKAADYLKVQPAWLRTLVNQGRIAAHKAEGSGRWKFRKSDLDAYLMAGRKPTVSPK